MKASSKSSNRSCERDVPGDAQADDGPDEPRERLGFEAEVRTPRAIATAAAAESALKSERVSMSADTALARVCFGRRTLRLAMVPAVLIVVAVTAVAHRTVRGPARDSRRGLGMRALPIRGESMRAELVLARVVVRAVVATIPLARDSLVHVASLSAVDVIILVAVVVEEQPTDDQPRCGGDGRGRARVGRCRRCGSEGRTCRGGEEAAVRMNFLIIMTRRSSHHRLHRLNVRSLRRRNPMQKRARALGFAQRFVDRRRQHREVRHLATQRGVTLAVDVQFDVGVA